MSSVRIALANAPSVRTIVAACRHGELSRYFAASLVALSLDAVLLWVGASLLVPLWLAGSIAYGAGLLFIYSVSIRWVFARRAVHDSKSELVVFAALGLVGMCLNAATLVVASDAGIALPIAKAVSAFVGFTANFVTRKLLLFSPR